MSSISPFQIYNKFYSLIKNMYKMIHNNNKLHKLMHLCNAFMSCISFFQIYNKFESLIKNMYKEKQPEIGITNYKSFQINSSFNILFEK